MLTGNLRYDIWRTNFPNDNTYEFPLWNQKQIRQFLSESGYGRNNISKNCLENEIQKKRYDDWLIRVYGNPSLISSAL